MLLIPACRFLALMQCGASYTLATRMTIFMYFTNCHARICSALILLHFIDALLIRRQHFMVGVIRPSLVIFEA